MTDMDTARRKAWETIKRAYGNSIDIVDRAEAFRLGWERGAWYGASNGEGEGW